MATCFKIYAISLFQCTVTVCVTTSVWHLTHSQWIEDMMNLAHIFSACAFLDVFTHTPGVCLFQIKLDFMKMMEKDFFKGFREDTIKIGLF